MDHIKKTFVVHWLKFIYIYIFFLKCCIYLIKKYSKSNNCEILLQFKITVFYLYIFVYLIFLIFVYFKISFILMMQSWISASLLQSLVSHDPSEFILICWFASQGTFIIIIIMLKTVVLIYIFVKTMILHFKAFFDEQKIKNSIYFNICYNKCLDCHFWSIQWTLNKSIFLNYYFELSLLFKIFMCGLRVQTALVKPKLLFSTLLHTYTTSSGQLLDPNYLTI